MVEYFRSMVRLVGRCGSGFQGLARNVRHEGTRALGVGSEGWQGWTYQRPRHSFALRVTTGSLEGSPKIQGLTFPFPLLANHLTLQVAPVVSGKIHAFKRLCCTP